MEHSHTKIIPNHPYIFLIDPESADERLDRYLTKKFSLYSRNFFQRLINDGYVLINDKVGKRSTLLKEHDTIRFCLPTNYAALTSQPTPEMIEKIKKVPVKVVYEHPDFLIIEKPAHLIVHRPSTFGDEITLVDWLVAHFKEIADVGFEDRPGIVHRLDKDTSGLMIIPRNNPAHAYFANLFRNRKIAKEYYALVAGHPDKKGSIDLPIGRSVHAPHKMSVSSTGRSALTHYEVERYFDEASLIKVKPVTGRTHQIRVHFQALGHPLIGDELYYKKSPLIDRHALHASGLSFTYDGQNYTFNSPLPSDMQNVIEKYALK